MHSSLPLAVDDHVGNYVITQVLGSGATAYVFEAIHERLHQRVAVKVLRPALEQGLRDRFHREVEALVDISSPHVPQIHDVGELADGGGYLVMEMLRGQTLEQHLRETEGRGMSPERVVELAWQLAEALEAIHLAGWVHRDVKASNIVIHEVPGERAVLKLCDLGIAVRMLPIDPRITGRGMTAGTPEHMSPEQARGVQVDGRSDVFAAGTLLYRLLSGVTPFARPGDRPADIMRAVIEREPAPLAELCPRCPHQLITVVERCMAKAPAARFESARALGNALDRLDLVRAASLAPERARHRWLPTIRLRPGDIVVPALVLGLAYLGYTSWIEDPFLTVPDSGDAAAFVAPRPPMSASVEEDHAPLSDREASSEPAAVTPPDRSTAPSLSVEPAREPARLDVESRFEPVPDEPLTEGADGDEGDEADASSSERSSVRPRRTPAAASSTRAPREGPATTVVFDSPGFERHLDHALRSGLRPFTGFAPLAAPSPPPEERDDGPVPSNPYGDAG